MSKDKAVVNATQNAAALNGTAPKNGSATPKTTLPGAAPEKDQNQPTQIPPPAPSLEISAGQRAAERKERVRMFEDLSQRHDRLKERQTFLKKFMLSSDGSKETITIKNSNGVNFDISNTEAIKEVIDLLNSRCEAALIQTENEINAFQI